MSTNEIAVTSIEDFEAKATAANGPVVAYFFASWYEPCQQMTTVITSLAGDHKNVTFLKIEAEEVPEAAEKFNVQSVPTSVFILGNAVVGRQEGANVPDLVNEVARLAARALNQVPAIKARQAPVVDTAAETKALNERIAGIIAAAPVMLFMKGSPDAPKCGFSRTTVTLLKEQGAKFGYFDILTDDAVRQGIKTYSNWKTFPQLYINSELIGGLDVIREMIEEGEFGEMLPGVMSVPENQLPLEDRLKALVNRSKVIMFIKGTPEVPKCGFSRQACALMNETGVAYDTFDILMDLEVREGLKDFSNWRTFPQLYVDGELIGGLDVMREMHEEGELKDILEMGVGSGQN